MTHIDERYGVGHERNELSPIRQVEQHECTKSLEVTPGLKWQYSSGTSNIIARVIRSVLADDQSHWSYPRRALFDRLGMTGAVIETDGEGTFVGSSFTDAIARDWARFGGLDLQDGVWEGQRILPEGEIPEQEAVEQAFAVWMQNTGAGGRERLLDRSRRGTGCRDAAAWQASPVEDIPGRRWHHA